MSSQLENIAPQLNSLESALTESRRKLKHEQELRRAAEQAQDDADQRLRELEETIQHVRDECDAVHEELAFKENELEETKLELEVEKQQLQNELKSLRQKWEDAEARAARQQPSLMDSADENDGNTLETSRKSKSIDSNEESAMQATPSVDEAYVRKLEEELELVTEQLIETENRLSEMEGTVQSLQQQNHTLRQQGRSDDDEDLIQRLQMENADRLESEQKLMEDLALLKEELILAREEIALQQEELQAAEEDQKATAQKLEEEQARHREQTTQLTIQLKEAEVATKTALGEAAVVATSVQQTNSENEHLLFQIDALEKALQNAKDDYQSVLDELDAVNARFDEARAEAERAGRDAAENEVKAIMKADVEHEISMLKSQLQKLSQENADLQQKVDDTEMRLATMKDRQDTERAGVEAVSSANSAQQAQNQEVVKQLQTQLTRAKEDIAKKDAEMTAITNSMEQRLQKAEEKVTKLERDLHAAKGQLAESEARIIVLKREKETAEAHSFPPPTPTSPGKHHRKEVVPRGAPAPPELGGGEQRIGRSASSEYREELESMDDLPSLVRMKSSHRSRSTSPSSVMRLEYKLAEESKKCENLQREYDLLQDQKRMGEARIKRLEEDLRFLQKELFSNGGDTAVVTQMSRLSSLASKEKTVDLVHQEEDEQRRLDSIIESRDVKLMSEELKSLEKKCNAQREYNAQLLSKMLHLQGNIQVYCRVRPMTISEVQKGYKEVVESLSETEVGCYDSRTNKWKSFAFDRVWGPDQSQTSVFQDVEPLALSVIDGFNACIFAYGQTGSGKTFTMEGVPENNQYGISYRTIQKIFHLLNLRAQQQRAAELFVDGDSQGDPMNQVSFEFSLHLGMLEIYNDEVYDLLATQGSSMAEKKQEALRAGGKASLEIRANKDGRIEVPNLTKETVHSIQEVMDLLKRGNANRATAATDLNEHSSRSHMVLIVDVISGLAGTPKNKGTLYLVDLAGSERVRKSNVAGDQLKEAGFINRSLSALGNVMEALDRKASHVPYRDSKLTYLLQDSLGGNSRTMMVVTICPMDNSYDESVHALQFATRVRRIQIGAAQRNVSAKNLEETVKALTAEMRALSRAKERSESQLLSLKRDNARVQDKLKNITQAKSQNRADSKTLDVLRKNNDDMAARWQKEKAAKEEAGEELEKARKEQRILQQTLGKMKSKIATLERKVEETEHELQVATKQLRAAKSSQTASSVRARRDQVLNSRNRGSDASSFTQDVTPSSPTLKIPDPGLNKGGESATTGRAVAQPRSGSPGSSARLSVDGNDNEESAADIDRIRSQVLALLEKHDQGKVNRIDIIMEKFKGKEELLLEKMTQRYEGGSSQSSFLKRNEIALQRHNERMKRLREQKQSNGTGISSPK